MIKKGIFGLLVVGFFTTDFSDMPPGYFEVESDGRWPVESYDLVRDRRGDTTYIYGYPEGSPYHKDTLLVDLTSASADPIWIKGE